MRRLISSKKVKMFHATRANNLKEIQETNAIIPQKQQGAGLNFNDPTIVETGNFIGHTFFATTYEKAKEYAKSYLDDGEDAVILEFSLPESILEPDKSDCYECTTWKESAEEMQQVSVMGEVSLSYLDKIHYLNKK